MGVRAAGSGGRHKLAAPVVVVMNSSDKNKLPFEVALEGSRALSGLRFCFRSSTGPSRAAAD